MNKDIKVPTYVLVGLLFLAAIGLLTGLYAGLIRLDFLSDVKHSVSPLAHGPLMINGFLGTLIGLERAAAFPMLTIFGERLELNRIMRPPKQAQRIFIGLILGWILALVITHFDRMIGWSMASLLLIGIAGWLIQYDVARRTIKSVEWTRYSAICLLAGYGWLILAGL